MRNSSISQACIERDFCESFFNLLPKYPRTGKNKDESFVTNKKFAINNKYIEINHRNLKTFLILDIDKTDAYLRLYDSNLPRPTYISVNPENGHLQCGWKLTDPVSCSMKSRLWPQQYLRNIRNKFNEILCGDTGFADCLVKNPLHSDWNNEYYDTEYSLSELASKVDLCEKAASQPSIEHLDSSQRNTSLFDVVRKWSYKEIRNSDKKPLYETWAKTLLQQCEDLSEHFDSLSDFTWREIRDIANSIARYTYRRWNEFSTSEERYRAEQARRGALGGAISKRGPSLRKQKLLSTMIGLSKHGATHRVIARLCKVSASTVSLWLKEANKSKVYSS